MPKDYSDFERRWTQADDHVFRFQVQNDATALNADITGWLGFWVTAKRDVTEADPGIFQVSLVGGANGSIIVVDAAQGLIEIAIKPAATSGLARSRHNFIVDIQAKDNLGRIWTLARGQATILPEVTRATS
jgi:hypothetical protein